MDSHQYRWIVIIVAFFLAAVYFFVFSESGLLERINLQKGKTDLIANIEELKSENGRLHRLLDRYRKGHYPGEDLLKSGYIRPGEKVVYLRGLEEPRPGLKVADAAPGFSVVLPYLRIGWLAVSAIVVVLLIVFARKAGADDARDLP